MESNVIFPELPTYTGVPSLAGVLSLIVTVLLPVLAALFMRVNWSPFRKGVVLLAAAAVKTFLEAWMVAADTNTPFNFGDAAYTTVVQFGLAVVAYFGLMRDTSMQRAALHGGVVRGTRPRRSLQ